MAGMRGRQLPARRLEKPRNAPNVVGEAASYTMRPAGASKTVQCLPPGRVYPSRAPDRGLVIAPTGGYLTRYGTVLTLYIRWLTSL
jgi:hypothetical protein